MSPNRRHLLATALALPFGLGQSQGSPLFRQEDRRHALPSWNDGPAKKAILDFVENVTREGSPRFVPIAERVAVFDNDGTLWCEQPMYIQLAFAIDPVKAMANDHPEWHEKEPYASALNRNFAKLADGGTKALLELIYATHAGLTTDQFAGIVQEWLKSSKHPRFDKPYTECVFQPMLELLDYLRTMQFKTFIVSGGGADFMRVFCEKVYGVPPENVVGSSLKTQYGVNERGPFLKIRPEINFIDDKAGKPVGIHQAIGRRPTMAFGNSDGDYEMLEWTTKAPGPRFGMILHHTDGEREYAYDRQTHFGKLDRALEAAPKQGWMVAETGRDFRRVFPFEPA